jgi:proteasome lid subunit RPN8/RPN11
LTEYIISASHLDKLIKRAVAAAKTDGGEIAGLIVDNGYCLDLIGCKNKSRRGGGFAFYYQEVRRIVNAAKTLNYEAVGTFHSHPVGLAEPGDSDIANAPDDSLMLIIDCTNRGARLWHIKRGQAKQLKFKKLRPVGRR